MATVYLGIHKKLDRLVAIKVLVPNVFGGRHYAKRFLKEARTLSKLSHPNIISVFEVGILHDCYFIVMEYLQGSLKERIKKYGRIPPFKALQIISQIADALFYIHKKGLIHRDVKPENIMFRKDGMPVLLDFGIVKTVGSETKITGTGISIGTPYYMSPEQCITHRLDGRTDIYSLGVVLYEMLMGRVPFKDKYTSEIFKRHVLAPVPILPLNLKKYQLIINRMMAKEKRKRLRSKRELIEIIKNLIGPELLKQGIEKKTKKIKKKDRLLRSQKTVTSPKTSSKKLNIKSKVKKKRVLRAKKRRVKKRKINIKKILLWSPLIVVILFLILTTLTGYTFTQLINGIIEIFNTIKLFFISLFSK